MTEQASVANLSMPSNRSMLSRDSSCTSVTRGEQQESDQDRPFLAMYPLNDLSFLESKEFAGISVDSSLLPGTGHVFNFADFEYESYMRPVGIVTQEGNNKGE